MFAFLLDVVLFIFILILYYAFLMTPSVKRDFVIAPTSPRVGGGGTTPPYSENIDLTNKVIQVSGQTWNIVLDSNIFELDSKIISLKHPCDGKPKGSRILTNTKDIYRHTFLKGQPLQHEQHRSTIKVVDTLDSSVDYFYECGGKYHRLRQCPLGTYFVRSQCFASDVCRLKKNRYKYTIHGLAETDYYECQRKKAVGPKTCPPGHIFRFTSCVKPNDSCHLERDGHIVESSAEFYKFCRKGLTVTRYCGTNEYFHLTKGRCIPDTCRGKSDGALVGPTVVDPPWQYIKKYAICKDGIVEKQENCTRILQDETFDNDVELPRFKVFNPKTVLCEVPEFCVNITPSSRNVGSTRFRRLMANYKYRELYSLLNGYTCDSHRPLNPIRHTAAAPGKLVTGESVCDYDKTKTKYPIYKDWNQFFDCANNSVQDCPTIDGIFDYGSQQCIRRDFELFHKFDEGLPVFKFRDSQLHYNWIKPRKVRQQQQSPVTACNDSQIYDETYDICVDKRCQGYEFLSQLDKTNSSIPLFMIVDDFHQCVWDKPSKTVRYAPYKRLYNVKLDFWRQTFVPISRHIAACDKGITRLSTPNFIINATVWPTCNLMRDPKEDKPFVFCPSTGLSGLSSLIPTLCIPEKKILKIDLLPNQWYYVYINEFKFLHTFEDLTSIGYKFTVTSTRRNRTYKCHLAGNYSFSDITTSSFPGHFHTFFITVDKNAQLWRYRVPTNHPEYVVNEKGHEFHENFDFSKKYAYMLDSKFQNVKDAKFVFEKYSIDSESCLTGFS